MDGVIKGVRKNFRKLQPWAKANNKLDDIYIGLKSSFDHLDTYLKLFTPLSRRLNREKIELTGEQIRKYLIDIFDDRILRHEINLIVTEQFKVKIVLGFPSTLFPAFVNIVDNAIYWMTTVREGGRDLTLDADDDGFLIRNTGPGIERRHADRIFEYGMTIKASGRGMGLYISRETLRKDDFDLIFMNPGKNNNPCFHIITKTTDNTMRGIE